MNARKYIGQIHLWLGFAAGLVIVVSLLPAALFVWEKELTDWYYQDYVEVQPAEGQAILPVTTLRKNAQRAVPGKEVSSVSLTNEAHRAYVFSTWKEAEQPGWTWFSAYAYWDDIYVNPYTGAVTGVVDKRYDWITVSRYLHQNLLLNYEVGHLIVGTATLIMLVMVATGLVLWWPKNRKALKQRLKIKWNARWRRVNYDIHNVGGFYIYPVILLLATTGLVWTFDWWTDGIYRLLGDDPETVFAQPAAPALQSEAQPEAVDIAFAHARNSRHAWKNMYFSFPEAYGEGAQKITAFVEYVTGTSGWEESDEYHYDRATGERYYTRTHQDKSIGEKWRNSNYAIHVGSIYGWPTKVLASLAALFSASLPVTGFYIWWGRRKKSGRTSRRPHQQNSRHQPVNY